MTTEEFQVLLCIEALGSRQGLIPRGVTVKQLGELLYDEGMRIGSREITTTLIALRRRKLVVSRPGSDGALWLCTLYGRNVVSA